MDIAERLYQSFMPHEALEAFLSLVDGDSTGYALFQCGRIWYNRQTNAQGMQPHQRTKGEAYFTQSYPLLHSHTQGENVNPTCYTALGYLYDFGWAVLNAIRLKQQATTQMLLA